MKRYKIVMKYNSISILHFRVWPASAKNILIGSILSIFAINAWVLPYKNFEPNEVAWTVSTLFLWYWCFPFILPRLQRLSNIQLAENIVRCYWISVGVGILLHIALGGFRNQIEKVNIVSAIHIFMHLI